MSNYARKLDLLVELLSSAHDEAELSREQLLDGEKDEAFDKLFQVEDDLRNAKRIVDGLLESHAIDEGDDDPPEYDEDEDDEN